ncbi:UvrD-helicase domain-containing protein [Mycobacterium sp. 134]|uniref:UvrD-helicase domain-containing protein n=1 Tax=Mycobacterium sp. 134 TaxID=3400425 RepID=UPI003AAC58EC
MRPTSEQQAIVDAARSGTNLVIQAGAGTGKTSTLRLVAAELRKPTLYIAYNRAIADEASGSFPKRVQCRTAHSLANGAIGWQYRHRLNGGRQTSQQAAAVLGTPWVELGRSKRISPAQMARISIGAVQRFCYSADDEITDQHVPRQNGVIGEDHDDLVHASLPYARRAWDDICSRSGALRFEHDHYLKMWALTRPRLDVDVVMLDEAQDSNPLVARLVQDQDAQQIAVGDSCQSLYGWRGAIDALDRWNADEVLYLSQSWRFGPVIADEANKWLARIGTRLRLTGNSSLQSQLASLDLPKAVLCRTNAGGMAEVMRLLAEGHRVALVGKGKMIRQLATAAAELKSTGRTSHPELFAFTSWAALQEFTEEDAGRDLKPFVDLIDAHGPEAVIEATDSLVDEKQADVVVSTAHSSKGREWDTVAIGDDYPSGESSPDNAKADAMVAYVAVTRARMLLDRGSLAWIDRPARRPQRFVRPSTAGR